jgi:MerR family transcriptional regulator, thiopeptide resistance regulator
MRRSAADFGYSVLVIDSDPGAEQSLWSVRLKPDTTSIGESRTLRLPAGAGRYGCMKARTYRVHEFAALAGVTVKALHHYDRLGLLKPARTRNGYRLYSIAHLARLEQVIALKALGIPLKQMRSILDREPLPLAATFRQQREVLEEQRTAIDRAIDALTRAERAIAQDPSSEAAILQQVIKVMSTHDVDVMRKYYSDEAWEQWKHYYDDWPSEEWRTLYREIAAALDEDPASDRAQALADRWLALAQREPAGAIRTGLMKAWADREHWPPALRRRLAEFDIERGMAFVNAAVWIRYDREREARARAGQVPPRVNPSRLALFREWTKLVDMDPSSAEAQAMRTRWDDLLERESEGDEEIKADMRKALQPRKQWPAGMKRYWAALYDTDVETWDRVVDFIDRTSRQTRA